MTAAHREELKEFVAEKVCQILKNESTKPVRILSVGCGDGSFDVKILETISSRFPDTKVQYVGTDIDKKTCEQSKEVLSAIKNVEVEFMVLDFQQVDPSKLELPPCDLVLAIQVLYYMKDLNKALSNLQLLTKPEGMLKLKSYSHNIEYKYTCPQSVIYICHLNEKV